MINRKYLITSITALFIGPSSKAYNLEIACRDGGQIQDWQIENATADLSRVRPADIDNLCADAEFCSGQFKAIGKLTRQMAAINKEVLKLKELQTQARRRDRKAILELQDRVDDCLNNQSPLLDRAFRGDRIAILYPHKGMNANQTAMYDRGKIEWIIENALKQGVDPFAALSIKLLEDAEDLATSAKPREAEAEGNESNELEEYSDTYYSDEYGLIPVDSIAAYDVNGCLNPKGTFNYVSKRTHAAPYARLTTHLETAREALIDAERSNDVVNYQIAESELEYLKSELDRLAGELSTEDLQKNLEAQSTREQISTIDAYLTEMQKRPEVVSYLSALENVRIYEDNIETFKKSILGVRVSTRPPPRPTSGTNTSPPPPARLSEEARQFEEQALEMVEAELDCTQNRMCYTSIKTPARRVVYQLDSNATQTHTICDRDSLTIDRAHAPQFSVVPPDEVATGCCVDVKANGDSEDLEQRIGEVKGLMGFEFIKQRVQNRARGSISHALQAFNGYGVFGSTEEMDNSCLEGIDMNSQPVYGARAADLMINGLMNNPAIKAVVKEKQSAVGRAPVSMFCIQKGRGTHKIDGTTFLNEQKSYLNRPQCQRFFQNRWLPPSGG